MSKFIFLGIFLFLSFGLFFRDGVAEAAVADHLVINEVQIEGAAGTGGVEDDWVELYNPTAQPINLASSSIQKVTAGGTVTRQALSGIVPAQGYFLIVRNGSSTAPALKNSADFLAGNSFSLASDNTIYLVDNNIAITPASIDAHVIDYVGFGAVNYYEGATTTNPGRGKSLSRVPDGEDTDNNLADFDVLDTPTPKNSAAGNVVGGTVLLTITPDTPPVRNITPTGADIVFQLNAAGNATINYGLTGAYGSSTAPEAVVENIAETISLSGLACNTTYHYSIDAQNLAATETDTTADASFTTLPCGITLNSLTMTKQAAKANNLYADGWQWAFDLTIWNLAETSLKMKFEQWAGAGTLNAGGNMQFSADNGASWLDITDDDAYPAIGADLSTIDNSAAAGRQVIVLARMKVPVGARAGAYTSGYGILTE
jgi:hypothetical protein